MLSQIIRRRPWTTTIGTIVGATAVIECYADYQEEYAGRFFFPILL